MLQGPQMQVLRINSTEWRQVRYITKLLEPFKMYTEALDATSEPTINKGWIVYNELYDHLENQRQQARQSGLPFTAALCDAINAAKKKLSEYYKKTAGKKGTLYNLGCILDPATKLSLYKICVVHSNTLF